MKKLLQLFAVAAALSSSAAFAQKSTQEILREMEASNRAAQIEIEHSRLRWQQLEADTARRSAELERLRLDTDRLRLLNESQDASNRAREIAERAEHAALEQAEAAKKAEEAAEELRDEMEQAVVRTRNYIYLAVFTLSVAGFAFYTVHRSRSEEPMKENQKLGIVIVVCSILAMLLAVMVSDDWVYRFDFLHNLMTSLRIKLFAEYGCTVLCTSYAIDFPTKYAVLACLCSAAYGFTTYLGITSLPKVLRKDSEKGNAA